jgi:hypothetical protein
VDGARQRRWRPPVRGGRWAPELSVVVSGAESPMHGVVSSVWGWKFTDESFLVRCLEFEII